MNKKKLKKISLGFIGLIVVISTIYHFYPKKDKEQFIEYVSDKHGVKILKYRGFAAFKNPLYSFYSIEGYISENDMVYISEMYIWGLIKVEGIKRTYKAEKPLKKSSISMSFE